MAIGDLLSVVTPPSTLLNAVDASAWVAVQNAVGTSLPDDLRDLGLHYGSGTFCEKFIVFNPFGAAYPDFVQFDCDLFRQLKKCEGDKYIPYHIFPDTPGLFPWGSDDNGHSMCWLTEGPSKEWPVILRSRDNQYQRFDLSMTSFLAKVLRCEIECILWPKKAFEDGSKRQFTPEATS